MSPYIYLLLAYILLFIIAKIAFQCFFPKENNTIEQHRKKFKNYREPKKNTLVSILLNFINSVKFYCKKLRYINI